MINYKINNKKTSLILCIFGGYLGLHHFYNKQIGKGILYLCTGGLLYIGWIIDIFKIASIKEIDKTNIINTNERYCIKCGKKVPFNAKFCDNCGNNLDNYNSNKFKTEKKNDSFVDDYIIFDLETTGLDYYKNKIIEIGALKYKNNQLVDEFHMLINPEIKLPNKIISITGITDDMLKDCETIDKVLPNFIEWIEDYTLIAHNSSFDMGFINAKSNELNLKLIKNNVIDTLYLARKYIDDTYNHKLVTLKNHFNLNYGSHRSLEDCYVTNYVYQYCKNK